MLAKGVKNYGIFFLTVLLLLLIFWQLDIPTLKENLTSLLTGQLLFPFLIYLASYLLRALRWQFLLGRVFPLPSIFHIVALHTVSNNVFPFRSGELTFPYFCKRFHNIPVGISTSTLVSARLADLCSLGPLFFISLICLNMPVTKFSAVFLIILVFLGMIFTIPYALSLVLWTLKNTSKRERFSVPLVQAQEQYRRLWKGKKLVGLMALSLAIWVVKFGAFFLIAKKLLISTTFHLNYWKVVLGSTASELVAALPLQTFAEFGMFEAGWAGAFMFMGMARKRAVTLGFSLHLTILLFSLLIGIPAYLAALFRKTKEETSPPGG